MKHKKFRVTQHVIIVKDQEVLILLHKPPRQKTWNFPGGHLEDQETLIEGLLREVREETQLEITDVHPYKTWIWKNKVNILYVASYVSGAVTLSDEHLEYKWVTPEQMKGIELTHPDMIKDAQRAPKLVKAFKETIK